MNIPSLPDFATLAQLRMGNPQELENAKVLAHAFATFTQAFRQLIPQQQSDNWLRVSSLGKCARQLRYRKDATPVDGKERDGRSGIVFAYGDLVEGLVTALVEESLPEGWTFTPGNDCEARVLRVPDPSKPGHEVDIPGHIDGLLVQGNVSYLLEIKSMTTFAFQRFEREGLGPADPYWWQVQGYMYSATGMQDKLISSAYILACNKDSGQLTGCWMEPDPKFLEMLNTHLWRVMCAADTLRVTPDGKTLAPAVKLGKKNTPIKGHGVLPWNCSYCPYHRACWPEAIEEVGRSASGAPKAVIRVES